MLYQNKKSEKERYIKKNKYYIEHTVINMLDINPTISIIYLDINDINSPIKGQVLLNWPKTNTQTQCIKRKVV